MKKLLNIALAAAVLEHDAKRALDLLGAEIDEGLQLGEMADQLIAYWRDLMVLNCTDGAATDLSVAPRHHSALVQQAKALKLDTILAGLDLLNSTRARLRNSNHGRVLLEMALVRLGRLDDLASLSQLAQWLEQGQDGPVQQPRAAGQGQRTATAAPPESVKKKALGIADGSSPAPSLPLAPEHLPRIWEQLLAEAGPMLAGLLKKAEFPAIFAPNTLVIRFDTPYNSEREHCSEPARVTRMEEVLRRITGQPCKVRVDVAAGSALAKSPQPAGEPVESISHYRRQRAEAGQEPLLKRAIEVLGAQIVQVDDGFGVAPLPAPEAERDVPSDVEEA